MTTQLLEIDGGDKANLDECHELLDLLHIDGTVHDLDQYPEERMQTTLGQVLCCLLHEYNSQRETIGKLKGLSKTWKVESKEQEGEWYNDCGSIDRFTEQLDEIIGA
jgi:hypothetical protein